MSDPSNHLPYPEVKPPNAYETALGRLAGGPPDRSKQSFVAAPPNSSQQPPNRPRSGRSHGRDVGRAAPEIGVAAAQRPTGLVLEGRLATSHEPGNWTLKDDPCPLDGAQAFDRTTGEIVWRPTCKSARCRRCSRQVSAQTFALARRALEPLQHVRFITLTQAPGDWDDTRQAIKSWLLHLRREGLEMNALTVVETGKQTGMKHVHAVQWGDFVPIATLERSWPHGSTQIAAARAATDYLSKGVLRYVAKGIDGDSNEIEEHMNLNGGRAAHWTRGFFAGHSREGFRQANPLPGIYFIGSDMPDNR